MLPPFQKTCDHKILRARKNNSDKPFEVALSTFAGVHFVRAHRDSASSWLTPSPCLKELPCAAAREASG